MVAMAAQTNGTLGVVVGATLLVVYCFLLPWLFTEVFPNTIVWIDVKARQPAAAAVEMDAAWSVQEESDPRIYAITTQAHFVSVEKPRLTGDERLA